MSYAKIGWVKGRHVRFIRGHAIRLRPKRRNPNSLELEDGHAVILLRSGSELLRCKVDAEDIGRLSGMTWGIDTRGYAWSQSRSRPAVRMHRFLLNAGEGEPLEVDHINQDKLDNRKSNLRLVNHALNNHNRNRRSAMMLRGCYEDKRTNLKNRYRSHVTHGGREINLGRFATAQEAHEKAMTYLREHNLIPN